jgi:hypothetical protein
VVAAAVSLLGRLIAAAARPSSRPGNRDDGPR